jgi:hypothetical protein
MKSLLCTFSLVGAAALMACSHDSNQLASNGKTVEEKGIRVISATYGDKQSGKTCKPDLSLCKGLASCEFEVGDGLCQVEAPVKNLEVEWDCGPHTEQKARAAAKGTRISISCTQKER